MAQMDTDSKKAARQKPKPTPSLKELQTLMAQAVMRPLTPSDRMQRRWEDGRPTREVVEEFIKPNDHLSSFERLEIYNRQYWFRLLDCLNDDYPGLRSVLGDTRFIRLATAYINKYPSTSSTLRDLGSRLIPFLQEEPKWTKPHQTLALDMARLEWAQIVAFDAESQPSAKLELLGEVPPDRIYLRLQPYITLLDLAYPVDEIVIRILRQDGHLRNEASNAMEAPTSTGLRKRSRARGIHPEPTKVLVHRHENSVYFKRLTGPQFQLLQALNNGASLAAACETLTDCPEAEGLTPDNIQAWFQNWSSLGFLVPLTTG